MVIDSIQVSPLHLPFQVWPMMMAPAYGGGEPLAPQGLLGPPMGGLGSPLPWQVTPMMVPWGGQPVYVGGPLVPQSVFGGLGSPWASATVRSRTEQFLIAKKSGPLPYDVPPFDLGRFEQTLKAGGIADCTHVRTLARYGRGTLDALSAGGTDTETMVVAEMPEASAMQLRQHPGLVVEPDHLSVSSDQRSELVEQKIQAAKRLGVAGIVAAGSAGGPVQYPASSPHVLAMAAIGKEGECPPESYSSAQVLVGDGSVISRDGFFAARFSSFGPEIDVCAPGVAILSSVPPNNYAVWDGTSMAAPHVTGLAALILAHHADFQGPYTTRNAPRVERLFHILKQSAQPLHLGDPHRVGAGLPDALKALNVAPQTTTAMPASMDALVRQLVEVLQTSPLPVGARSAVGASVGATLAELQTVMRQAGLLVGNGTGTGLQGAPSSVTPGVAALGPSPALAASGAGGTNGVRAALQACKTTLHQVGLL